MESKRAKTLQKKELTRFFQEQPCSSDKIPMVFMLNLINLYSKPPIFSIVIMILLALNAWLPPVPQNDPQASSVCQKEKEQGHRLPLKRSYWSAFHDFIMVIKILIVMTNLSLSDFY